MKFLLNKYTAVLVVAISLFSCEDFLGGDDFNVNPNRPASVPVKAQLPEIELQVADLYGGDFSRFNCMFTQQVEGVARQWASFNNYSGLTPTRFSSAWVNMYENILIEADIAEEKARAQGLNHYLGVINTVEAFALLNATDVWGDMPYSEALQGLDNFSPAFDPQESIYSTALNKLDEAITLFDGDGGISVPGRVDFFYEGDPDKWTRAARAIKARSLMKQDQYAEAAELAKNSFASPEGNLAFQYLDANNAAQWYRFNRDRTGDIEIHPFFVSLLTDLNDTLRLQQYNPEFKTDHPYFVADFLQELITYRELQFIIAEVGVRDAGNVSEEEAYEAYLNGIRASFTRLGLSSDDADAYLDNEDVAVGADNLDLEDVMTQKYIALFAQPEVYSDWRRTGIPNLEPVTGTAIPVRWHYGADEYLFNANAPQQSEINIFTSKVAWDED